MIVISYQSRVTANGKLYREALQQIRQWAYAHAGHRRSQGSPLLRRRRQSAQLHLGTGQHRHPHPPAGEHHHHHQRESQRRRAFGRLPRPGVRLRHRRTPVPPRKPSPPAETTSWPASSARRKDSRRRGTDRKPAKTPCPKSSTTYGPATDRAADSPARSPPPPTGG